MKKLWLIFTFFLFLFPLKVNADSVDYKIKNYYIDANIMKNGDLEVTELIVLKGSFNGYIRDIEYKNSNLSNDDFANNRLYNATGIEIIDVSAKKVQEIHFSTIHDTDFKSLTKGQASNYGFLEKSIASGKQYKMYFKSNNESVAFRIKYKIQDAVVLHEDIAELYWTFIGQEYDDDIKDLQIKVNLPNKDTSDSFRIWAHGEISGEIQAYENQYLLATVNFLEKHQPIDIRTTFSTSLLDASLIEKKSNKKALDEIIRVETKRAEEQNKKRMYMKILYYVILIISGIYLISLLIVWIYVYFKFDKEYKSDFFGDYYREFIDEYNVEVVDYLINKKITPNAMSASIMNLIYKKIIKVEELPSDKKKKDYIFHLTDNYKKANETEQYLIEFLFNKVGKENTFTIKELQAYAKGTKTCEKFATSYTTWKNKVIRDGKKQNFFEKNGKPIGISVLFLLFSIFVSILTSFFHVVVVLPFCNTFLTILFLLYTCFFFKRTKKGNEDYVKWMAFKKFLNDFGSFSTKELPEVALWERYMVYATVFGLAEKVSKVMNVKIKELETSGIYIGGYSPTFSDWYVFHSITNSITNSVHSNASAITATRANSSSSSGSGFGGGFSSGGGFGGGGGGGRGF